MKKLESLKKLRTIVENTEELASGKYCSNGKNCVVGHLLLFGGMTQEQLKHMDNGDEFDGCYAIGSILENEVVKDNKDNIIHKTFVELGFDIEEDAEFLKRLQNTNDGEGKREVLKKLDYKIELLEEIK